MGAEQALWIPLLGPTGPRLSQVSSILRLGAYRSKGQLCFKERKNQSPHGHKHRLPQSLASMHTSPVNLVRKKGRGWGDQQALGHLISLGPPHPRSLSLGPQNFTLTGVPSPSNLHVWFGLNLDSLEK